MNQDWQEQEIRRRFREARRADEGLCPPFAAMLAAAFAKAESKPAHPLVTRFAVAVLVLVALAGLLFFKQSATPSPGTQAVTAPADELAVPDSPNRPVGRQREGAGETNQPQKKLVAASGRRARVAPSHSPTRQPATLLSGWQSPTDFLLHAPGGELLKTVPRFGDSAVGGNGRFPDRKN